MRLFGLISLACLLMAATVVLDIFDDLSCSRDLAKEKIVESFGRGSFAAGSELVQKARQLPEAAQAEGARQLVRFAREYTQTSAFKKQYARWRNEQLGYKQKKKPGILNPMKMLDKAVDKQLNKGDDEKRIPSDPEILIRQRLQEFLDIAATVDFDATLSGRMFSNPAYESKSPQWKMCYRAGKAVITAAEEEVREWLKEIE